MHRDAIYYNTSSYTPSVYNQYQFENVTHDMRIILWLY